MISVARHAEPLILIANKASWLIDLKAAKMVGNDKLFKQCQKKYGHTQVKDALVSMFSDKCAYCESIISGVTTGHIEHFRPKSRFLSLTFEWSNLLLSCPKCNDKAHKGDKFPSVAAGGRLLDPTLDNPANHFDFVYDATTQQALIIPKTTRGSTTVKLFALNSRKSLVKVRSSLIKKLILLKTYELTDPDAAALLVEAKKSDEPYLAWANALV